MILFNIYSILCTNEKKHLKEHNSEPKEMKCDNTMFAMSDPFIDDIECHFRKLAKDMRRYSNSMKEKKKEKSVD